MIATVARQQLVSLRRQRIFVALVGILLFMTAMAGVIGWMSRETIVRVYDEAVRLLASNGQAAPPNPFELKPTLSMLSNMSIYIPLIGALLAIVLGHLSLAVQALFPLHTNHTSETQTKYTQLTSGLLTSAL